MHRYTFEHSSDANYDCALNSMKCELIARNVAHEKQRANQFLSQSYKMIINLVIVIPSIGNYVIGVSVNTSLTSVARSIVG